MDSPKKPPTRAEDHVRSKIEPLIDTEEAAALLQIHPKTLQRMARRGEVRGYRFLIAPISDQGCTRHGTVSGIQRASAREERETPSLSLSA